MSELDAHIATIREANGRDLMALTGGFNTLSFVQDLKAAGVSNETITQFFLFLAKACLDKGALLPREGYLDMVRFAADHGLLKK